MEPYLVSSLVFFYNLFTNVISLNFNKSIKDSETLKWSIFSKLLTEVPNTGKDIFFNEYAINYSLATFYINKALSPSAEIPPIPYSIRLEILLISRYAWPPNLSIKIVPDSLAFYEIKTFKTKLTYDKEIPILVLVFMRYEKISLDSL